MGWLIELVPYDGDAIALLPDEILETTGWTAGDELDWQVIDRRLILTRRAAPASDESSTDGP